MEGEWGERSAVAALPWSKTQPIGSGTQSILVSRSVYFGPKLSPSHLGLKLSPSWSRDRSILLWKSVQVILLGLALWPKSAFSYYQSLKPTRRTRLDRLYFYLHLALLTCEQTFPFTLSHRRYLQPSMQQFIRNPYKPAYTVSCQLPMMLANNGGKVRWASNSDGYLVHTIRLLPIENRSKMGYDGCRYTPIHNPGLVFLTCIRMHWIALLYR